MRGPVRLTEMNELRTSELEREEPEEHNLTVQ